MPFLCQIRADGEAVERWGIGDKPVIFGRGARADVRLQDDRLSREHFAILRDGSGFVVCDLNSKNGTWVGDQRILRLGLKHHDCVRAGRTLFLFEEGPDTVVVESKSPQGHATEVLP